MANVTPQRFDLFISYAREDQALVRQLCEALKTHQRRAWVDWEGIPPTAEWMRELFAAIESAHSFVFVISKASLRSAICAKEVEHASVCGKRLIPLVWGDVGDERVPDPLGRLHWITCRDDSEVPAASALLIQAIETDLDWVHEHTRLLVRTLAWRDAGHETSRLLHGADLAHAERWLTDGADKDPRPTTLHRDYVLASRAQETRRSRRTLAGVATALVIAVALAVVAWSQRQTAETQRQDAVAQRATAEDQRAQAEQRRLDAERQSVLALTNESDAALLSGREIEAIVAALTAGRKLLQEPALRTGAPAASVYRTLIALRRAVTETHERNRFRSGHTRGTTHVAFSPDGTRLFSVGGVIDIKGWSLEGKQLSRFETDHHGLADGCSNTHNFAISPDGQTLLTLGNEGRFARWTADGKFIDGFDTDTAAGADACTGILESWIDVRRQLVSVRDEANITTRTFKGVVVDGGAAAPPEGERSFAGETEAPVNSPDGRYLARNNASEEVEVIRKDGSVVMTLPPQDATAFNRDGTLLATVAADLDNEVIHLWDVERAQIVPPKSALQPEPRPPKRRMRLGEGTFDLDSELAFVGLYGHNTQLAAISADGSRAAVVVEELEGVTEVWDLKDRSGTPRRIAVIKPDQALGPDSSQALNSLAFSPDAKALATGGTDGTVKIWDGEGRLLRRIVAHRRYAWARYSPDGLLLLTWPYPMDREMPKLWTTEGEQLDEFEGSRPDRMWFTTDGQWVMALTGTPPRIIGWSLDLSSLVQAGCARLATYLRNPSTKGAQALCK